MRKVCRAECAGAVCRIVAVLGIVVCGGGRSANAQATQPLSGASFQKQLAQPASVHFAEVPLRKALEDIGRANRVAVLLDRRVDPGQKLDMQLAGVSLEEVFRAIAKDRRLGVSVLDSAVYFGPPRVSQRLRTLIEIRKEEVRRLPPKIGREFLLPRLFEWEDFATPRALLGELARQHGWELDGVDRIPHDLWAGVDLPALSPVEQLTLILVQLDLTFRVDANGRRVTLVRVPSDVSLVRDYPGGRDPEATAERLARLAPDAQIKVAGNRVYVKGLVEDHQRIASPRRTPGPQTSPGPSLANMRFTLEDHRPARSLLEQLAGQLKLELRIDEAGLKAAGISLQQKVPVRVEKATLDALLDEVAKPLKLRIRRKGNVVEIGPGG